MAGKPGGVDMRLYKIIEFLLVAGGASLLFSVDWRVWLGVTLMIMGAGLVRTRIEYDHN